MSKRKVLKGNEGLYQVWATSYPLPGDDPATDYDPGYYLIGQFKTIFEAVKCHDDNKVYEPLITKFVTWKTEITDISETSIPKDTTELPHQK